MSQHRPVQRRYWRHIGTLGYVEPGRRLFHTLLRYKNGSDRFEVSERRLATLVSSHVKGTKLHAPILDLDYPHRYVPSSTPNHGHLYLDVPIPRWRMIILILALRQAKVLEPGTTWWSIRRGAMFVRRPGVLK